MNQQKSMESILQFWQDIISDDEIPVQNRMKASELLYRSLQQEDAPAEVQTEQEAAADLTERIRQAEAIIAKYGKGSKKGDRNA